MSVSDSELKGSDPDADPGLVSASKRRPWLWVLAAIAVGVAAFFVGTTLRPHIYAGTVFQSPSPAPPIDLIAHTGEPVDLEDYRGEVVLLYFGYTHCPDVCPLTLSNAAKAIENLGRDGDRVNVMMVTVDPERDTPDLLGEYVTFFDESFLGLYGPDEDLARTAALYGVFYQAREGTPESGYLVDHTATLMAIDPDGFLRVLWTPDVSNEDLTADLEELLG